MARLAQSTAATTAGRRSHSRVRLDFPAEFLLIEGHRRCRLKNISVTGCSLTLPEPPRPGAHGFVRFAGLELFAQVVWSNAGMCGVEFDDPLPLAQVVALRELASSIADKERRQQEQAIRDWVSGRGRIIGSG